MFQFQLLLCGVLYLFSQCSLFPSALSCEGGLSSGQAMFSARPFANALQLRTSMSPLPASDTKHLDALSYELPSGVIVEIAQNGSAADSTGRSLWLGAQVRSTLSRVLL